MKRKQPRSVAPKRKPAPGQKFTPTVARAMFARHNAARHLRAWHVDANPWHVVNAYLDFRELCRDVPEELLALLDGALKSIRALPPKKPRPHAVRDAELEALFLSLLRSGPERIAAGLKPWTREALLLHIGQQHGLKSGAKMPIERLKAQRKNGGKRY